MVKTLPSIDEIQVKLALDKLIDKKDFMDDIDVYYFLVDKGLAKPIIDIDHNGQKLTFKPH